ncbi:MAG: peptidoglycan DD-metalloendopeptidase family protein [Elainellaceae cyanobacterium]
MSNPLKTGSLLTTACLAWAALDAAVPRQAHAESMDIEATSSSLQPVTPSPIPQTLIPVPSPLSLPQVPRRDEASFRAVDEIVPNVTLPNRWPVEIPLGTSAVESVTEPAPEPVAESTIEPAISIEVEPFSEVSRDLLAPLPDPISLNSVENITIAVPQAAVPQVTDTADNNTVTPLVKSQFEEMSTTVRPAESPSESQKSDLLALVVEPATSPEPRGWFDRQMAETLARRQVQREAQLRENLIASARQHLKQNNIAAAQQIAQNPVFLDAERTALQQAIAAGSGNMEPPAKLEPTTQLAKEVARLAARQSWLLDRLPATAATLHCDSQASCLQPQSPSSYAWLIEAANRHSLSSAAASTGMPLATAAPITSRYGWRTHPLYGDRRFHAGVDFGAPHGTPVRASLSGYVETSEYLDGYGYTVILENGSAQERHLYAHLADMAVYPGQQVNQGDVIGWVGSTGNSTGPHLHFEVHQLAQSGWITVDPLPVALR